MGHRVLFLAGAVLEGPVIAIYLLVVELSWQLQDGSLGFLEVWLYLRVLVVSLIRLRCYIGLVGVLCGFQCRDGRWVTGYYSGPEGCVFPF